MADPVRDFKLDASGDMDCSGGAIHTIAGEPACKQGIKIRVRMFKGDVWLNQAAGIDYLNDVLVKAPDPNVVRSDLLAEVEDTPDVVEATSTQLVIDGNRNGSIKYKARTAYSTSAVGDTVKLPGV